MLTATDPLPARPARVLVAGVSGSGKTTLAARVGAVLGIPHTEIDSLFHGPDWTPRPSLEVEVDAFTSEPSWVTEWQYSSVRPLLAERADTLLWLDLPYPLVFTRVLRRTLRRRLRREVLWNGNVEGPLRTFFTDPEHVVRWSISTRKLYRDRIPALVVAHPQLTVVRLRRRRDVDHWLREVLQPLA
ncbi:MULTISPECIES: AAA family ATPase [unclassified Nocardioides]|uniref:AAA family ATPase n=1 Tax=unclassified Nocardioides TaxID=2615069 RepID=UPI0009F0B2D6|nr:MULTISPECIES: AAA family ATPase [unclassified Nocardioides]GAW50473.1 adenylate kinase [Nocardioides sp. PD653-B2]GAW53912.1 adenylate kinase [Nocardioides sp. PD653]